MEYLQVNPRLVVWPGDHMSWIVLDAHGRPGQSFALPEQAVAVLKAFLEPRRIEEVFITATKDIKDAIALCVEDGLLARTEQCARLALFPEHASLWAGFIFQNHIHTRAPSDLHRLIARRHILSGRKILVVDDCLDQTWIHATHRWFFQLPYRRVDADTLETTYSRHWVASFVPARSHIEAVPLFARLASLAVAASGEQAAEVCRIDGYSATFGDFPLLHRDLESGRGITALFYANPIWDPDWAGETIFCNDFGEATILVPPRPARLVVFDGALLHRAGAPSRACHDARYALAFKFSLPGVEEV